MLPPEEGGELGTRRRTADGPGEAAAAALWFLRFRMAGQARWHRAAPFPRGSPPSTAASAPTLRFWRVGGLESRERGDGVRSGRGPDYSEKREGGARRCPLRREGPREGSSGRQTDRRRPPPQRGLGGGPASEEARAPLGFPETKSRYPGVGKSVMILPQVHLRKPCYDFYFL